MPILIKKYFSGLKNFYLASCDSMPLFPAMEKKSWDRRIESLRST